MIYKQFFNQKTNDFFNVSNNSLNCTAVTTNSFTTINNLNSITFNDYEKIMYSNFNGSSYIKSVNSLYLNFFPIKYGTLPNGVFSSLTTNCVETGILKTNFVKNLSTNNNTFILETMKINSFCLQLPSTSFCSIIKPKNSGFDQTIPFNDVTKNKKILLRLKISRYNDYDNVDKT
jgi:hypothetical protein